MRYPDWTIIVSTVLLSTDRNQPTARMLKLESAEGSWEVLLSPWTADIWLTTHGSELVDHGTMVNNGLNQQQSMTADNA